MKPFRDDTELAAALRELRPHATARVRRRARRPGRGRLPPRLALGVGRSLVRARLASTPPRRLIAPAGALALTAVVIATAVVADHRDAATGPPPSAPGATQLGSGAASGAAAVRERGRRGERRRVGRRSIDAELGAGGAPPPRNSGPYAAECRAPRRRTLGRDRARRRAERVRADAAEVFDAVHAADGIVLRSSIRDGEAGEAGATSNC